MHFREANRTMPHMHSKYFVCSTVVISSNEMYSPSAQPWQHSSFPQGNLHVARNLSRAISQIRSTERVAERECVKEEYDGSAPSVAIGSARLMRCAVIVVEKRRKKEEGKKRGSGNGNSVASAHRDNLFLHTFPPSLQNGSPRCLSSWREK
jgi:hypothetical protein